jgi:Tfp pilus assembly protein PilF
VHLFDAHAPYEPPREQWDGRSHPYYGEVAFADAQLGRLLDWLEESGRAADTLVVVTADHGESLGEHGELTHSTLVYDATLHVPLVVSAPGYCAAGVVVETPVHLVDVFASVCEVLDWGLPAGAGGRSFAPALRGAELAARPLYAESEYARINFGWGRLRALYDGDWKYIDGPRPELYDLARDPRELTDQIAAEPARAARMRAALEELLAGLERRRTGTLAPDEELTHGMAALGYAQASAPAADIEVEDPRNPAELVHVVQLYLDAVGLCQRDAFAEAAPLLERAIEADPRAVGFRILLAVCQRQTGHPDAAIETLEGALVLEERQERAHLELAHALLAVERDDEALAHALRAVEIRPGYREARMKVAELYLARGERDLCLEQYRAVLAEFPLEDGLRNATVALLRDMGRERERLEALEGGIRDNPVSGPDWAARTAFELATHPDAELRDDEKALLYARAANQASGRRAPRHLDALAAAQASVGRFDAALKNATEAARLARAAGLEQLAAAVEARLERYRAGQPFRAAR